MSGTGPGVGNRGMAPVLAAGVIAGVLAIIAAIAFALWVLAHPPLPGLFSDSINYLQVADYFAASFDGTVDDSHREQFAATRFPPLYSLVLAAAGAGLQQWNQAINLSAFLVGAYVVLALAWLRQQTGALALAFVLVPIAVLAPQITEWLLLPLSEPLYAIIVLGALLAAGSRTTPVLAAAALVALAPLCRSAGLALVIAFVAWLATHRDVTPTRRMLGVVIAALPAAGWVLYRSTQPVLGGYAESLSIEATIHAAGGIGAFAVQQSLALHDGAAAWLDPALPGMARALVLVLAVPVIAGLVLRARDRNLDAWYMLVYLGVVAIWPYPNETARLLSVAAPMLAIAAWTAIGTAIGRLRPALPRHVAQGYAALALCAVALAGSFGAYQRLLERTGSDVPADLEPARRWTLYLDTPDPTAANDWAETLVRTAYLVDEIATAIPPGACVYTTFRALVDMRAGYAFRTVETPVGMRGDEAVATMTACDHVLVTQLGSPQRAQPPLYPLGLLGERATVVLASEGERHGHSVLFAALVRIEREPAPDTAGPRTHEGAAPESRD